MDQVTPDWEDRLRAELEDMEDSLHRTFGEWLLSEPKEEGKSLPKTKTQRRPDAIVKETWRVAITGNVWPGHHDLLTGEFKLVPQITVKGPPKEYAWTESLPGYEAARTSAINALHRLWASTQAAAAGFKSKTPWLAALWVSALFWLMSDRLIAEFLSRKGIRTTRQTVSQAVLQMGLTKHEPPIVKSIGESFQLRFVEGYPPKR
jgi:hypothetical protein